MLLAVALVLAAGAGGLTASALGVGTAKSAKTVTINVATGPRGPAGPPGPQGLACPNGYEAGKLVINHPGGQTAIWTCLQS